MHRRIILSTLLLGVGSIHVLAGQSSTAGLTLRGRVGVAAMLAPSENNPLSEQHSVRAQLLSVGGSIITVRLTGSQTDRSSRVRVRLLMRSNADYELFACSSDKDDVPAIAASVAGVRSTGSGVISSAVSEVQSVSSPVELSGESMRLASGPRISRGGAASSRNAIEIEIVLEVEPASVVWSEDVFLAIRPL